MSDWRKIEIGTFIDIESINKIGENIFECWVKTTKGSYVFDNTQKKYNQKLGYQLCKYLIDYVEKYGMSKVAFVIIYSIKNAAKSISSSKIVDVSIVDSENTKFNIDQISNISINSVFGISDYTPKIEINKKIPILICVLICVFILAIFGTLSLYLSIKSFKHAKEINFKIN